MKKIILGFLFLINVSVFSVIHEKVIIGGICKDIEKQLPKMIRSIESIGELFDDYRVIIYENNSRDKTKKLLNKWSRKNSKVFIQSENLSSKEILNHCISRNLSSNSFARCENLARARNIVLHRSLSENYNEFNYFMMIDLDFDLGIPINGVIDSFSLKDEWDVCFADGIRYGNHCNGANYNGAHYDLYTLLSTDFPIGPQFVGDSFWNNLTFDLKYSTSNALIPVCSAFSGVGIYKKNILKNVRYCGHVTEELEKWALKFFSANFKEAKIQEYFNANKNLQSRFSLKDSNLNAISLHDLKSSGFFFNDYGDKTVYFRINCNEGPYPTCCEHVPLNISLYNQGYRLCINPRMKPIYTR